jgi:O-antigen/teichoic acid export membrane protein
MINGVFHRLASLDSLGKRMIRNIGLIAGGDVGASALAMLSLALTARALGPELLGILVMIETYATLIDRWIRPETWQALIKYGTDALADDDDESFKRLVKFGFLIDIGGGLLAMTVAILGVQVAAHWFGWEDQVAGLASLYCASMILRMTSTQTAVLRLFDRFGVFVYSQMAAASIRLVLVTVAWWMSAELMVFVLISMVITAIQPVLMFHATVRVLRAKGYHRIIQTPLKGVLAQYPRILRFMLSANLSLLLRKTVENTDVLIVGAILGPASSGNLHIVKRLANLILKLGTPIQQVIYPDVSKLWAKGETHRFRSAVHWTNLLAGCAGLVVLGVISIDPTFVLNLFAGEAFAGLSVPLLLQMLAMVIFLFGIALRSAMYSMEQDWMLLKIVATATASFYLAFLALMPSFGMIAACLGHCAFNAVWLALTWRCFRRNVALRLATA